MTQTLLLPDQAAFDDLGTFVGRARKADPDGAARLVGHGGVLAVYVSPVHGGGGPTVLGLRTVALAAPSDLDVTVPLSALSDRLARDPRPAQRLDVLGALDGMGPVGLAVPPVPATGVSWAGVSPPRARWELLGLLDPAVLEAAAIAGIAEIAQGAATGSGALAVAQLRAAVWGRPLLTDDPLDDVPSGVAFVGQALGFLGVAGGGPESQWPAVFRHGPWVRLTTERGHVLGRRSLLGL